MSLMLGVIIVLLPQVAGADSTPLAFLLACYTAAVVPFGGFVTFLCSGLSEWRYMKDLIREREKAPATTGGPPQVESGLPTPPGEQPNPPLHLTGAACGFSQGPSSPSRPGR